MIRPEVSDSKSQTESRLDNLGHLGLESGRGCLGLKSGWVHLGLRSDREHLGPRPDLTFWV